MALKTNKCFEPPLNDFSMDNLFDYFQKEVRNQDLRLYGNVVKFLEGLHVTTTEMYPECFHHVTTKKDKKTGIREPEERRFYINHIVPMLKYIENCKKCDDIECSKIRMWTKAHTNRVKRTKLLYIADSYNYMIILEPDHKIKNQFNIVTSYLGNEPWFLEQTLKEFEKYKK